MQESAAKRKCPEFPHVRSSPGLPYARNTIQGDMDDVLANKDSIKYENVFTGLESGTCLLIEGRPGSGKTTLVQRFSQDWGRGKYSANNY